MPIKFVFKNFECFADGQLTLHCTRWIVFSVNGTSLIDGRKRFVTAKHMSHNLMGIFKSLLVSQNFAVGAIGDF